jgi:Xaa-Pro aminopeptidase
MSAGRGERLAGLVAGRELDFTVVTEIVNVRYLTGFTGTNGACVCGEDTRIFLTDFRYTERAEAEVEGWEVVTVEDDWLGGIATCLSGKAGFEDDHLSVRTMARLEEKLPDGVELVAAGGDVEKLRRVKDGEELKAIAAASELADEVWRWSLERGLGGRTEIDIARAAEARIRELGGEPSFPAIVAAGANGALPHAEPGEHEVGGGELIVFDMGAKLDDYCSDGTRTFGVGEPDGRAREVYELVLAAQLAALDAVRPGVGGEPLDEVAREMIEAAGYGDRFGHGLGHGVGLEVHEGPRVSRRSEDVLAAGEVVTIEPGVYLPGELGVRIEDLVVVNEDGYDNLSSISKDMQIVD